MDKQLHGEKSCFINSIHEGRPNKSQALVAVFNQHVLDVDSGHHLNQFNILFGCGLEYYENPGNRLFRQVIEDALPNYTAVETKHAKSSIVSATPFEKLVRTAF
jgi:hypothetical protein